MGWIDKVNQWVLKRIHPWAIERVKTDREGTTLIRADGGSQFIRWSDVQEIAVLKQADGGIPCPIGYFALHIHAVGSTHPSSRSTVRVKKSRRFCKRAISFDAISAMASQ